MSDLTFSVHATSLSPTRTTVRARQFEMIVDEPPEVGGNDSGANPVEFILTGLVGCLNVVAHVVAGEMKINLSSLEIRASGALNPERLFGIKTEDRAGYKNIEIELIVDSDADEQLLQEWLAVVESRCPVFDNLSRITPVSARLAPYNKQLAA